MRKVVLYELLSLDGVAESPDLWMPMVDDEVYLAHLGEVIAQQDAVLLGRAMYDDWAGIWPGFDMQPFADFINGVPKYVATRTPLQKAWSGAERIAEPLETFVKKLKAEPGGDIGVHGSISLAQSLLRSGLVDELRLVVAPTLAGKGRKLFDSQEVLRRLTLQDGRSTPSGLVLLSYSVA
ncbi:dihydrofolate reductase family protein [Kineosporia sp. NBRC 101731]|uniref:dihydrofolate reductase family protein n=1 Tax=Kineosporia sp. NBRC 101731 TaxID=3032199 RepID=UPI0024A6050F|nr:dihydrofolate reductase family protein [Kineosporia sp. NBRC 101731]GLY26847.1 dihydrofolate reductase [Kineosporia sp. NBRC 101731]